MCKIIRYWYTCNHGFRLRVSQCGGTKHKRTRSGPTPACKSESFLSVVVPIDCGPCQHLAFEVRWRRKLLMADLFLDKLKAKGFPGAPELAALVEQLRDEFNTATWDTRLLYPHMHKDSAVRVQLGYFERRSSPLRQEVRREDIGEPEDIVNLDHPDYEYDWDYVASTDPLHPIDTNYAHPLDDVDPSWMLNHLTPEEFEQTSNDVGFDASEADTLWSNNLEQLQTTSVPWDENSEDWPSELTSDTDISPQDSGQRCEVRDRRTAAQAPDEMTIKHDKRIAERIDMVIEEFRRLVNGNGKHDQLQDHKLSTDANGDIIIQLNGLHIPDPGNAHNVTQTDLPTPPPTPPRLFPDDSCESPALTESQQRDQNPSLPANTTLIHPYHSAGTAHTHTGTARPRHPTNPNSTRTPYNKLRQHISKTKNVDEGKFYRDWLELSRYEIKDVEGLNGRLVQDPQVPLQLGARNGWWR